LCECACVFVFIRAFLKVFEKKRKERKEKNTIIQPRIGGKRKGNRPAGADGGGFREKKKKKNEGFCSKITKTAQLNLFFEYLTGLEYFISPPYKNHYCIEEREGFTGQQHRVKQYKQDRLGLTNVDKPIFFP